MFFPTNCQGRLFHRHVRARDRTAPLKMEQTSISWTWFRTGLTHALDWRLGISGQTISLSFARTAFQPPLILLGSPLAAGSLPKYERYSHDGRRPTPCHRPAVVAYTPGVLKYTSCKPDYSGRGEQRTVFSSCSSDHQREGYLFNRSASQSERDGL